MTVFGKYNEDGSVAREATECALTGASVSVQDGSVREKIPGTAYFIRVHPSQYGNLTDDMRDLLAQRARENPNMKWEPLDLKQLKRADKPVIVVSQPVKAIKAKEGSE